MRSNGLTTNIANFADSLIPRKAIFTYNPAGFHIPAVWQ